MAREHRHGQSAWLDVYVAGLAIVASVLVATAVPRARLDRPWLVVVVVAASVAFRYIVLLPPSGGRIVHSFTLIEVAVVFGVATLPAADLMVAVGIAALLVLAGWPRCWHKAVFNAVELVIGTAAAAAVGNTTPVRSVGSVLLLGLAGLSYSVVSQVLTYTALAIAEKAGWSDLRDSVGPATRSSVTSIPLGILAAAVADRPVLLVLCLVPVGLVLLFAASVDRARVQHDRASALAAAGQAAVEATTPAELIGAMLAGAGRITHGVARMAPEVGPAGTISLPLPEPFGLGSWLVADAPPKRLLPEADVEPALRTLAAITASGLDNIALRARLERMATTDELTGLGNRREFVRHLDAAVARAGRGSPFGVLFVDLDRFKTINDTYGHATGDLVLREVAARLRLAMRADDRVFRLAGDEFTVIADGVADDAALALLAATLTAHVSGTVVHAGHTVEIAVSVGGAMWHPDLGSAWALVSVADQRMYDTKSRPIRR